MRLNRFQGFLLLLVLDTGCRCVEKTKRFPFMECFRYLKTKMEIEMREYSKKWNLLLHRRTFKMMDAMM